MDIYGNSGQRKLTNEKGVSMSVAGGRERSEMWHTHTRARVRTHAHDFSVETCHDAPEQNIFYTRFKDQCTEKESCFFGVLKVQYSVPWCCF